MQYCQICVHWAIKHAVFPKNLLTRHLEQTRINKGSAFIKIEIFITSESDAAPGQVCIHNLCKCLSVWMARFTYQVNMLSLIEPGKIKLSEQL